MAIQPVSQHGGGFDNARIQDFTAKAIRDLQASLPFFGGRLLEGLAITTSSQAFEHKLGRVPKGFMVVRQDSAASIFQPTSADANNINLQGSGAVTVTVWVF